MINRKNCIPSDALFNATKKSAITPSPNKLDGTEPNRATPSHTLWGYVNMGGGEEIRSQQYAASRRTSKKTGWHTL